MALPGGLGHEFGQNVLFAWEFGYDGSDPSVVLPEKVSAVCMHAYCLEASEANTAILVRYQNEFL